MVKLLRRQFLQLATGAVALPAILRIANAQSYPLRPVTIIVPTGAGGPQDVVARIITGRMRSSLGQPLIIDNVPGANGTLGIGRVARAKSDGYALALSVSFSTHVVNGAIYALPCIKAYAVMAKNRSAAASDIPTVDEAGLPGFYAAPWYALWAPKGTPRNVIDKLNGAVVDALADASLRGRFADLALQVFPREQQTPEAFQKAEIEKWWPIIKAAGIKAE